MTGQELNLWRQRLGLTITQAAQALHLSRGRMVDSLYDKKRPPSRATAATALLIEERAQRGGDSHT